MDVTNEAATAIENLIKESVKSTNNIISTIVSAVFGEQGQSQDIIPQAMRRGEVSSEQQILIS